jgi:hypothetical protein
MTVITTGSIPAALRPGLNKIWGQEYTDHPQEWRELVDVETSTSNYEEDMLLPGFGLAPVKPEGAGVSYDTTGQGPIQRYTHVAYGLGFIVTREAIDDNKYVEASMKRALLLARSFRMTKENVVANVYNRAFNSSYVGSDGKELIATDHPSAGGVWSNELATPADLSEASLEDMLTMVNTAKDERGFPVAIRGLKLVVHPSQVFEAERILGSTLRSGSSENDINAVRSLGLLSGGVVANHFLTDPDAWFIKTDAPDGLKFFQRIAPEFAQDNDFDTSNLKFKGYERYSTGWTDPRGLYGSAGA